LFPEVWSNLLSFPLPRVDNLLTFFQSQVIRRTPPTHLLVCLHYKSAGLNDTVRLPSPTLHHLITH
jgi:hypothetical protein